ncbi:hypothetical protein NDU88_003875 [Pleurodeles waltl]|uniref:Uncharacterized protein n=1 Tax=Pleurodeles waltl TaxID=8319 RepID=A0AAV7L726_PLEWA|nr:hypothetical protein NDU88_003875 [Pleurodeles waltl]
MDCTVNGIIAGGVREAFRSLQGKRTFPWYQDTAPMDRPGDSCTSTPFYHHTCTSRGPHITVGGSALRSTIQTTQGSLASRPKWHRQLKRCKSLRMASEA